MVNPKQAYLSKFIVPDKTLVVTDEDLDFWKEQRVERFPSKLELPVGWTPQDRIILAEVLQKAEDPINWLKIVCEWTKSLVIIVPYEYGWPEQYKPFKNEKHVRQYDFDLLAEHLEAARLSYVLELIESNGWMWLGAQATKT